MNHSPPASLARVAAWGAALALAGCPSAHPPPASDDDDSTEAGWECVVADGADPDFTEQLGCRDDFDALASAPLDASIPGARSAKTVMDRLDDDHQYFQNSVRYPIHWDFAFDHLGPPLLPPVPQLAQFNQTEYFSPDRRFVLGALTWYEGPQVWAWEMAPYDAAGAEMIAAGFRSVVANTWVGDEVLFHPTSDDLLNVAADLPDDVPVITTDELFEGIDYQPLNLATSTGQLRFVPSSGTDDVGFREIVVLESVPNDIPIVAGIVTEEFQTPLSHINVLSQNRGTPNMSLRGAWDDETLRDLEGKWVELTVGAFDWSIREITQAEADAWWEENRPEPIVVDMMNTAVTELTDITSVLDLDTLSLEDALGEAVPAFGGKASHFAGLAHVPEVPNPPAFVIPVYYFDQHMQANGLWDMYDAMVADPQFSADREYRRDQLDDLRDAIEDAPVNPEHLALVMAKLADDFPGVRMRFRSSTNAEDVNGFTGAGLYESKTGDPNDSDKPVDEAMRKVWASVYSDRAWEERSFYGIEHRNIGMALLVHRSFPDEDCNGVAITANLFDPAGLEPGFYVNVQVGEESVVAPDPGVTTDQFIHYYTQPGQPIVYLFHSSLVPEGETVLTNAEVQTLGDGLNAVHEFFRPVYGTQPGVFYGMDVEFKFDSSAGNGSELYIKQARPYPGWAAE